VRFKVDENLPAEIAALRIARQDKPRVLNLFEQALPQIERAPWEHQLWIVDERQIRIREA
jgi:hypothetical protein